MLPTDPVAWAVKAFRNNVQAAQYKTYRRYLNGDHSMEFARNYFSTAHGGKFAKFVYNRCHGVVNAHANRMQITGFGADADTIAQEAQILWDDNTMDVREGHVEAEAFGAGDSYVILGLHPERGEVYLYVEQAHTMRVHWDDSVPGMVDLAAKAWLDDDEYMLLTLYFTDRVEKYRSRNRAPSGMPSSPGQFEQFQPEEDTTWPVPLPLNDTVPVFHFGNNALTNDYGVSEIAPVLHLQDSLNFTLMNMLIAEEYAIWPQRVIINADVSADTSKEAVQAFQAGVNKLLVLYGADGDRPPSIDQFDAADMDQYLKVAESWDVKISRVSDVPVHYLTQTDAQESGRKLRIAEAPFIAKIEDRQRAFGDIWSQAMSYGLRLKNIAVEPGKLRVNWQSAAPLQMEDKLEQMLMMRDVGFGFRTILEHMGYEPDQINAAVKDKEEAADAAMREFNRGAVSPDFGDDGEEEGEA